MKPIRWLSVLLVCLVLAPYAQAQESDVKVVPVRPNLDTDMLRYIVTHERKQVFDKGMKLDAQQQEVFWGLYHQFEKEKEKLDAKRLHLLGTYISKQSVLTNDDAITLVKHSGENQKADLALRQKYFKLMSKKLNPIVAARFVQIDDIVGMAIRLAILGNVPLIGDALPIAELPAAPAESTLSETAPK
jgi:hypothetical protein